MLYRDCVASLWCCVPADSTRPVRQLVVSKCSCCRGCVSTCVAYMPQRVHRRRRPQPSAPATVTDLNADIAVRTNGAASVRAPAPQFSYQLNNQFLEGGLYRFARIGSLAHCEPPARDVALYTNIERADWTIVMGRAIESFDQWTVDFQLFQRQRELMANVLSTLHLANQPVWGSLDYISTYVEDSLWAIQTELVSLRKFCDEVHQHRCSQTCELRAIDARLNALERQTAEHKDDAHMHLHPGTFASHSNSAPWASVYQEIRSSCESTPPAAVDAARTICRHISDIELRVRALETGALLTRTPDTRIIAGALRRAADAMEGTVTVPLGPFPGIRPSCIGGLLTL